MMLPNIILIGLIATTALATPLRRNGERFPKGNFTVAAVRAVPPLWTLPMNNYTFNGFNLDATVDFAVGLIEEAEAAGAGLIAFPETYFPGYPKYADANLYMKDLIDNSLVVGSAQWKKIVAVTQRTAMYVALGFSERDGDYIYMGQALLSPTGEVLIHRRKLRPSGGERNIWSDGEVRGLQVVQTPYGRMGMLECWEHFHPSMTFNVQAQNEQIHIGAWPYMPNYNSTGYQFWQMPEVNLAAARTYAISSGAMVVAPAIGVSEIYGSNGLVLASSDGFQVGQGPNLVYASVNTTGFNNASYTTNGEISWGTLEQIVEGFPVDIPKVEGTFVVTKKTTIADLLAGQKNGTLTHT